MWRGYQREGVPIISSWLHVDPHRFRESDFRPLFWERAFYQMAICTGVIAYRLPDENWDHAWSELFFARHLRKPIYSVGMKDVHFDRKDLIHCRDIIEAIGMACVVPADPVYPERAKGGNVAKSQGFLRRAPVENCRLSPYPPQSSAAGQ